MAKDTRHIDQLNASVDRMRKSCVLPPILKFKKPTGPRQVKLLEVRRSLELRTRAVSR